MACSFTLSAYIHVVHIKAQILKTLTCITIFTWVDPLIYMGLFTSEVKNSYKCLQDKSLCLSLL